MTVRNTASASEQRGSPVRARLTGILKMLMRVTMLSGSIVRVAVTRTAIVRVGLRGGRLAVGGVELVLEVTDLGHIVCSCGVCG